MIATQPELYHLPGFDEPFSAISHLLAAVLFLFLGWKLLQRGHTHRAPLAFLMIYSFACVFLFSMSTLFHMMITGGTAKQVMERLDHGAIFILIAGTFTAVHGIMFHGWFRWIPLIIIWIVALTGITLKIVFFEWLPDWVGLSLYLGLGWSGAFSVIPIFRHYGLRYFLPLALGGIAYSIGAIMNYMGWFVVIPGVIHAHELWHIAVLIGALCHWYFVWDVAGDEQFVGTPTPASLTQHPTLVAE